MPIKMALQVEGIAQLQRKLRKEVLLAPALREAMGATLKEGRAIVSAQAPRRSGRMAASVTYRLDARQVPTWGRIAVTARSKSRRFPRGFAYPRWLEFAPKSPRQGWLRHTLAPVRVILQSRLEAAKKQIEEIWSS